MLTPVPGRCRISFPHAQANVRQFWQVRIIATESHRDSADRSLVKSTYVDPPGSATLVFGYEWDWGLDSRAATSFLAVSSPAFFRARS